MTRRRYACLAVLLLVAACSKEKKTEAQKGTENPTIVEQSADSSIVTAAHPEQFPIVQVDARRLQEQLKVNGVVAPDINRTVPVNALTGGRVIDLRVRLGDEVRKDQMLMTLLSNDVLQAISDLHKFEADELYARQQLQRTEVLLKAGARAVADLEAAQNAANKAKTDLETGRQRLRVLGTDPDKPSAVVELHAPVAGTIVAQNVTAAAGVRSFDASPDLFTIADLSRVWLLCDVYENNLSQVRLGDSAEVRLNAYPDRPFKGQISNIGRVLDPNTRTAKVRIEIDNGQGLMRPGMFAVATLFSQGTRERMALPASAVLRLHDRDWVFLPLPDKKYQRREIHSGLSLDDGFLEVLDGLKTGDRVVRNALQFSSSLEQ